MAKKKRQRQAPKTITPGNLLAGLGGPPLGQPVMVVERTVEVPVRIPEGPEAKMTPFDTFTPSSERMDYWNRAYDFDTVSGHRNNIYEVWFVHNIRGSKEGGWWVNQMGCEMHWLSIKRLDQRAVMDWRHLQKIKNELVGPENEAIQLHPAESRLHDTANQFHLFVFANTWPEAGAPIGWTNRIVEHDEQACEEIGSVQRPFQTDK